MLLNIRPVPAPTLTNLTITPAIKSNVLKWDMPTDPTYAGAEIWASSGTNVAAATKIGKVIGNTYTASGTEVSATTSQNYWVRAVNIYGRTDGAWSNMVTAKSALATNLDIAAGAVQASNLAVAAIDSTTGNLKTGAVQASAFASGIAPVGIVSALPSVTGYTGPQVVMLTTDQKLYRYSGTAWTAAVPVADLTGKITAAQIAALTITANEIAANTITAAQIKAASITTTEIASRTILASNIKAGEITANEIKAGTITANEIWAGYVYAGTINANQISAGVIDAARINAKTLSIQDANGNTVIDFTGLRSGFEAPGTRNVDLDWKFLSLDTAFMRWNFTGGTDGFSFGNSTPQPQANSITWTPTTANAYFSRTLSSAEQFKGSDNPKVRARVRRISGTGVWEGNLFYSTSAAGSNHNATTAFYKNIPAPMNLDQWNVLEWDMANLTNGGTDWLDNIITTIRIDLVSDANTSVWEIDWVAIGVFNSGVTPTDVYQAAQTANWDSVSNIPYATVFNNDDSVALGFNPAFADWTGAYPAGWGAWSGGAPVKETVLTRVGKYAARFAPAAANTGMTRTYWFRDAGSVYAPLPADTFLSGTVDMYLASWTGPGKPGILVRLWYSSTLYRDTYVPITLTNTGVWQRMPWTARLNPGEQIYGIQIYIMASYTASQLGGSNTCDVIYDNLRFALFDSSVDNKTITVAADGTLNGAGGGKVSITGLGYTGDLNASSDIMLVGRGVAVSGNNLAKTTVSTAFDSDAYSTYGYTGGAFASAIAVDTAHNIMFGLNTDPLTDSNYPSLDYAVYLRADGNVWTYESGSSRNPSVTYVAGDVFAVTYDGSTIRYLKNGAVFRSVPVTITDPLFFDSSFQTAGGKLNGVRFGPLSSNNWNDILGTGKPENNATVGATAGVNLKDSLGAVLADAAIKNSAISIAPNLVENVRSWVAQTGVTKSEGNPNVADGSILTVAANGVATSRAMVLTPNTDYMLSFKAMATTNGAKFSMDLYPDTLPETQFTLTNTWQKYTVKWNSADAGMSNAVLRVLGSSTSQIQIGEIKLAKGAAENPYIDSVITPENVAAFIKSAAIGLAYIDKASIANLAAISAFLGSAQIGTGGYLRQGQTAFDTGTGFWLGDVSGVPKFSIGVGSGGPALVWDGTTLTQRNPKIVTGFNVTLADMNLTSQANTATYQNYNQSVTASGGTIASYSWSFTAEEGDIRMNSDPSSSTANIQARGSNIYCSGWLTLTAKSTDGALASDSCHITIQFGTGVPK